MRRTILLLWLLVGQVVATVYVSPSGTDGSGTQGDPFNSVASALANGDSDIVLLTGTYTESIIISARTLTITSVANGAPVLDAAGQNGILVLSNGADVTLTGLRMIRGYAEYGGAIRVTGGSALRIIQCQFESNVAMRQGGAVCVEDGSLHASECTFQHNAARSSSLDSNSMGGAIAIMSGSVSAMISRSVFTNNSVTSPLASYGGAVGALAGLNLSDSKFTQNSALHGAAVSMVTGALRLNRCNISSNEARDSANLDNVPATGGGLYAARTQQVFVGASRFDLNTASTAGAVMVADAAKVSCTDCTMSSNTAVRFGGAVAVVEGSTMTMTRCYLNHSRALKGGAVYVKRSRYESVQNTYVSNSATETAGAFYLVSILSFEVTLAKLNLNQASSTVGGGVLYSDTENSGTISFSRSRFSSNVAARGPGGVMVLYSNPTYSAGFSFVDCDFERNYAADEGGALAMWAAKGNVTNSTFIANSVGSGKQGSSLFLTQDSKPSISQSRFVEHVEASGSSMMLIQNSAPLVKDCTFRNNTYSHWLVLTLENSAAVFTGCVFDSNRASSDVPSAALHVEGSGSCTVYKCVFRKNSAAAAAAMLVGVKVSASISQSTFESNNSTMSGGALMINSTKSAVVYKSTFKSNNADRSAGAVLLSDSAKAHFISSEFSHNTAGVEGGAMASRPRVKLNLQHCRFVSNAAATVGGAIAFAGDSFTQFETITLQQNSTFIKNQAMHSGGAVYWHTSSLHPLQQCSQCTHLDNMLRLTGAYGINQATDVAQLAAPSSSQHKFIPGIPTQPGEFYLNLEDAFGQVVSSSSGSGVRCALQWADQVEQLGGDTVRFSSQGVVSWPEVWLAGVPHDTVDARFNCSFTRCGSSGESLVYDLAISNQIDILSCNLGEYRENQHELQINKDGSQILEETGRVRKCVWCPTGSFTVDPLAEDCNRCPVGATCPGGPQLVPKTGYWKVQPEDGKHYKCDSDGCEGGVNSTCAEGYHGRVCGHCSPTHAQFGYKCESCEELVGQIKLYTPLLLLIVVSALLCVWYSVASQSAKLGYEHLARKLQNLTQVFIAHCQTLVLVLFILTGVPWPQTFRDFIGVMRFFEFNLFSLIPKNCLLADASFGFYDAYVCTFCVQFVISAVAFSSLYAAYMNVELEVPEGDEQFDDECPSVQLSTFHANPILKMEDSCEDWASCAAAAVESSSGAAAQAPESAEDVKPKRSKFKWVVIVFEIMYPGSCMSFLRMFACRDIGGTSYLVDDVDRICYSAEWMPYALLGVAAFSIFLFGFPFACYLLLYKHRDNLEEDGFAGEFSVLYDAYSPEVWYGQSVSYLRKFMLVGAIMFLAPGSTSQTAVTFCIAYFSMISHIKFAPFADIAVNRMQLISELTLVLTLFCGLGLQVHFCKEEQGTSKMIITGSLVLINVLASVLVIYLMVQNMVRAKRNIIAMKAYSDKLKNIAVLSGWAKWRDVYANEAALGCLSESAVGVLRRRAIYEQEPKKKKKKPLKRHEQQSDEEQSDEEAVAAVLDDDEEQQLAGKKRDVGSRRQTARDGVGGTRRKKQWQQKTSDDLTPSKIVIESPRSSVDGKHISTLQNTTLQSVLDASRKEYFSKAGGMRTQPQRCLRTTDPSPIV